MKKTARAPNLVIVENKLLARLLCLAAHALQPADVLQGHVGQEREICCIPPRIALIEC